jgi:hypothetical protein
MEEIRVGAKKGDALRMHYASDETRQPPSRTSSSSLLR